MHVTFLKQMKSFVSGILEMQGDPITLIAGGDAVCSVPPGQTPDHPHFGETSLPFLHLLQAVSEDVGLVLNVVH